MDEDLSPVEATEIYKQVNTIVDRHVIKMEKWEEQMLTRLNLNMVAALSTIVEQKPTPYWKLLIGNVVFGVTSGAAIGLMLVLFLK